jgi:3'-5' exoribonuclease
MVADLQPGQQVDSCFAVIQMQFQPYKDPAKGHFLSVLLGDSTGEISGKLWHGASLIQGIASGDVVKVTAKVEEYRGTKQLNISQLAALPDGELVDLADFLPTCSKGRKALEQELKEALGRFTDPALKSLLTTWFSRPDFWNEYLLAPGAKRVHHAYLGGLAEHSLEVFQLSSTMAKLFPAVNEQLVLAGALIHDVGKMQEYQYKYTIDLTDQGKLLGHIVLGYQMLQREIACHGDFPEEYAEHLGHMILSHHGEMQYGSPVEPQTIEAAVLHQADLASSQIKQYAQTIESGAETERWLYNKTLGRNLYRGFLKEIS